jgi:hypothetical protein
MNVKEEKNYFYFQIISFDFDFKFFYIIKKRYKDRDTK